MIIEVICTIYHTLITRDLDDRVVTKNMTDLSMSHILLENIRGLNRPVRNKIF